MQYWKRISQLLALSLLTLFIACGDAQDDVPSLGFVDAFEDNTIDFFVDIDALESKKFGALALLRASRHLEHLA